MAARWGKTMANARHTQDTFATMCLHANMNPGYISRQMGHTNARMFFEVYSKWIDADASDRERSKLDALFASSRDERLSESVTSVPRDGRRAA